MHGQGQPRGHMAAWLAADLLLAHTLQMALVRVMLCTPLIPGCHSHSRS